MNAHKAGNGPDGHHGHGSVRLYLWVFLALIIGTIITVVAWRIHLPTLFLTVLVALLIATVKASLVAGWFMHLASEQRMIYAVLAITTFMFIALMVLTFWAMGEIPRPIFP